jgi:hypothetical protein
MTELSCKLPPAKDSSSIAAKSSREGLYEVAVAAICSPDAGIAGDSG